MASRSEDPTATIRQAPSDDAEVTNMRERTYQNTRMSARAHLFELYPLLLSLVVLPRFESASTAAHARSLPYPAVATTTKKAEASTMHHGGSSRANLTDDARELARKMLQLLGEDFARV